MTSFVNILHLNFTNLQMFTLILSLPKLLAYSLVSIRDLKSILLLERYTKIKRNSLHRILGNGNSSKHVF